MKLRHLPSGLVSAPGGWSLDREGNVIVNLAGRWVLHSECESCYA